MYFFNERKPENVSFQIQFGNPNVPLYFYGLVQMFTVNEDAGIFFHHLRTFQHFHLNALASMGKVIDYALLCVDQLSQGNLQDYAKAFI